MRLCLLLFFCLLLAGSGVVFAAEIPAIEMVAVKGGCFQMGDVLNEGGADERPVHRVCVDDFQIGRFEVTQAQWQAVMGSNPSRFRGDDRPVDNVRWVEALEFVRKLQWSTGKNYRLPTEAEWEYAARSGGKAERYAGGNETALLGSYAWYAANSGRQTHPVGQLKPNGLGLYDMGGNVWEWCQDFYLGDYYAVSPEQNPAGPPSGKYKSVRGGSWRNGSAYLRVTNRFTFFPFNRDDDRGLRVVLGGD